MTDTTRPRFWLQVEPSDDTPHAGRRLARVCKELGRAHGFKVLAVGEIEPDGQVEPAAIADTTANEEG
jgi:hypothetical protein